MAGDRITLGSETVAFVLADHRAWPDHLFGVPCLDHRRAGSFRSSGPGFVVCNRGRFEGGEFELIRHEVSENCVLLIWKIASTGMRYETRWTRCQYSDVMIRDDRLVNESAERITIRSCRARIGFPCADYEIYCQSGRWAYESQGRWVPLHTGRLTLSCQGGRTAQWCTPFACVRERGSNRGIAFHVLPRGNWLMQFAVHPRMHSRTGELSAEFGQAEELLAVQLPMGSAWQLPRIVMVGLPDGTPESGASAIHRYALRHLYSAHPTEPPVVYNTWLDRFDDLHPERLHKQLAAARELGCEVFTVDAGWFSAGRGWYDLVGDWNECMSGAFRGRMSEFADTVRAAGLKFGLWMEPERCGGDAPIRKAHPEFFTGGPGFPRYDIEQPDVYEYLRTQIRRLLDTYHVDWIKIDYNAELGDDERGTELRGYYDTWYRMLDELRAAYPQVFFEGCSSGGMRLELENLRHYDVHFLSDTCNAWDALRIMQGTALRLPPGLVGSWLALQARGMVQQHSSAFASGGTEQVLTANPSSGQPQLDGELVDPDFAALAALTGTFGLSGDIASLPSAIRTRIAAHVAFYKKWRGFIRRAHVHLLTPAVPITDRTGWAAMQFCDETSLSSLVFVYRLSDGRETIRVRLREIDLSGRYRVTLYPSGGGASEYAGGELASPGLAVAVPRVHGAVCAVVEKMAAA